MDNLFRRRWQGPPPCAAQSTASVLQEGRSSWPGEDTDSMLWAAAGQWMQGAHSSECSTDRRGPSKEGGKRRRGDTAEGGPRRSTAHSPSDATLGPLSCAHPRPDDAAQERRAAGTAAAATEPRKAQRGCVLASSYFGSLQAPLGPPPDDVPHRRCSHADLKRRRQRVSKARQRRAGRARGSWQSLRFKGSAAVGDMLPGAQRASDTDSPLMAALAGPTLNASRVTRGPSLFPPCKKSCVRLSSCSSPAFPTYTRHKTTALE